MGLFEKTILAVMTGCALALAWAVATSVGQMSTQIGEALIK